MVRDSLDLACTLPIQTHEFALCGASDGRLAVEAYLECGHALAEGREGRVVAMADLDIPGHPMRLGAIFIAGGHPGRHRAQGRRAADGGEGIPGPDQAAVSRRDHLIEGLKELKAGREREGAELARLINDRLTSIEEDVVTLRELVPQMLATQRQKVLDRFADMKAEMDPQRLEQEMVMLAQKSDVAEELDRLSTHIIEVRRVLKSGGAAGRRLDFLMQELNREANTLGSKAFDPRSTQAAVNLKVLIEQMREQVQNIE